MHIPGVTARAVILGVLAALACGATAGAQKFRTLTDDKKGFKVGPVFFSA